MEASAVLVSGLPSPSLRKVTETREVERNRLTCSHLYRDQARRQSRRHIRPREVAEEGTQPTHPRKGFECIICASQHRGRSKKVKHECN